MSSSNRYEAGLPPAVLRAVTSLNLPVTRQLYKPIRGTGQHPTAEPGSGRDGHGRRLDRRSFFPSQLHPSQPEHSKGRLALCNWCPGKKTQTHRGCHVRDSGGKHGRPRPGNLKLEGARRDRLPCRLQRECQRPDFRLSASRTVRQQVSAVLRHPVCCHSPRKPIQ